jgi:Protein of unknown function (DUF3631)
MTLPSPKICRRIRQLFALIGSPNANEAANARDRLTALLAKHGLSWIDIPACVAAANADDDAKKATPGNTSTTGTAAQQNPSVGPEVNVLDLVLRLLELHVAITPEERMAVALWILHTHVFVRFPIAPRLALMSPVRGCGKTLLLVLLDLLVANSYRTDNVTAAAIYYLLDRQSHSLLIDEGDNLGLLNNAVLRSVFNSGHRRGGTISRFVGGRSRRYPTFAPLAVAAIGMMPLPLLHRSVVINMQRTAARIERLNEYDPSFAASREQIQKWAATCSLAQDPEMPPALRNRAADNWRGLLAIADDLGHGKEARTAAIALSTNRLDEDPGVVLLGDIGTVFLTLGIDRIASAALIEGLLGLDDGMWSDWRGPHDDRPPRKLNQADLARLLRPFGITPKTIWPAQRQPGSRSSRGYLRSQFELAWQSYCPSADTPTHTNKTIQLPGT